MEIRLILNFQEKKVGFQIERPFQTFEELQVGTHIIYRKFHYLFIYLFMIYLLCDNTRMHNNNALRIKLVNTENVDGQLMRSYLMIGQFWPFG